MKKFVALILAVLMMISLVACGNSNTPEQASGGNEQVKSSDTESGNDNYFDPHEITMDNLMKAPDNPERDFDCVDHDNGDVELLGYLGHSEIVVIPEIWNGKKITSIGSDVFGNDSPVKAIRLSDSVTNLEYSSFGENNSLEIVVCGSGLTTIGEKSFYDCPNLHTVELNDGLKTIECLSFAHCYSLTELEIPDSVTEMQPMTFYDTPEIKVIGKAGSVAEECAASEGVTFVAK